MKITLAEALTPVWKGMNETLKALTAIKHELQKINDRLDGLEGSKKPITSLNLTKVDFKNKRVDSEKNL